MAKKKKQKREDNPEFDKLDPNVQATFHMLEKQFGQGIISFGNMLKQVDAPRTPSGSLSLDIALSGGWGLGRVVEIYGPESSGKTTLALHAIAEAQKTDGLCAFVDVEHALDPVYASALGVDMQHTFFSQPDCAEDALDVVEELVRSGGFRVIVIDSVSALVPRTELEGEMGDHSVGTQAKLMSKAMRKLAGAVRKSGTLLIFINQIRMKIGVMFGSPETTSGGNALKYFASQRVDIRRIGAVKKGDAIIGNETRVKVVKNKIGPPFTQAEIRIMYGKGLDSTLDLLRLAVRDDIVEKSGAWYAYEDSQTEYLRLGQGETNACTFLNEHPDIKENVRRQVMGEDVLQASEEEQQEDTE